MYEMYESLTELTQVSIVYAEVNGFVEKKLWLSVDYLFVVEVYWSDNRTTFVKRTYKEFLQFYRLVTEFFRSKQAKGVITTPVYIPKISSAWPWPFQRSTRELAEKREEELHTFLKTLLQGNPMVSSNKIVVEFFLSRPSDPVPYREPPDGAASDKHYQEAMSDEELNEDNEDDILFER